MRVVVAVVGVLALMAITVAAQSTAAQASLGPTVVARSMVKGKVKKPKLQPGAASKAAVKALPKAPKDQLIQWVRANLPGETESQYVSVHMYLNGQMIFTFEDLLGRGPDGIKALTVPEKFRNAFMDLMLKHIGTSRGVDDGMLVPTPPLVKAKPPKKACPKKDNKSQPRFSVVPPVAPNALVGDWLRRNFEDIKPLRMSRTILALERQSIKTFTDLKRVGLNGVKRLLHVPEGVREALREAIIYELGMNNGHDDGLMVPTKAYVPPAPVKEESC